MTGRRASIGVSPAVDIPGSSAEVPRGILQQNSCPPTAPQPPQKQRRQAGKIDGMDYHEWAGTACLPASTSSITSSLLTSSIVLSDLLQACTAVACT